MIIEPFSVTFRMLFCRIPFQVKKMDKVKMIYKVEILKCPSELFAKGIELRAEG